MGFALKQQGVAQGGAHGSASARPRSCSTSSPTSTASRAISPAASASASPWAARSCGARRSTSWTSRSRTSTRSSASRPATEVVELQHTPGRNDRLRDARPGRGDDDGRPRRRAQDGLLQQCDTPRTLYHEPANLFVAGFIGSPAMNMLPVAATGPLRDRRGRARDRATTSAASGATIGFRPEAVIIGDGPIPARIRIVEDLGSEMFVHLRDPARGQGAPARRKGRCPLRGRGPATTCEISCAARCISSTRPRRDGRPSSCDERPRHGGGRGSRRRHGENTC